MRTCPGPGTGSGARARRAARRCRRPPSRCSNPHPGQYGPRAVRVSGGCCETGRVPTELPELLVPDAPAWRAWLDEHHGRPDGVWLVLAKKGVSEPTSLSYVEALDEALCFGWIDGQVKRRDERTFRQRFTPRRARSQWSRRNVEHIERLLGEGRMHAAGLAAVESAKADGRWEDAYHGPASIEVPDDLTAALAAEPRAQAMFEILTSQNRYAILYRIGNAKRGDTRARPSSTSWRCSRAARRLPAAAQARGGLSRRARHPRAQDAAQPDQRSTSIASTGPAARCCWIARDQQPYGARAPRARTRFEHPRGAVGAHPPQRAPVARVVVVDEHRSAGVGPDVAQALQLAACASASRPRRCRSSRPASANTIGTRCGRPRGVDRRQARHLGRRRSAVAPPRAVTRRGARRPRPPSARARARRAQAPPRESSARPAARRPSRSSSSTAGLAGAPITITSIGARRAPTARARARAGLGSPM